MRETVSCISKWHRELDLFCQLKPLIVLEGNILDVYTWHESGVDMPLCMYLHRLFSERGYEIVVKYDGIDGFMPALPGGGIPEAFVRAAGAESLEALQAPFAGAQETAAMYVKNAVAQNDHSTVVIMDMASRYQVSPGSLSQAQVDSYTNLLKAAQSAGQVYSEKTGQVTLNLLVLIVNKLNDIPAWFYLDNPYVKTIHVTTPTKEERSAMLAGDHFRDFFDRDVYERDIPYYRERPEELKKIKEKFIGVTEGFTKLELRNLIRLCSEERFPVSRMNEVVDLYRYGIRENPWSDEGLREKLREGERFLEERVKGQPAALRRGLNVIKRAAAGMSGLQHSSHTKPRGILFFAGPTGTGKTETAKALAELLFGDESRCIRFDMSEYAQEHSDQRLLGAPPGYVGYEAGGQLTNAVRENPFSILLFDEIEKAHGSILDKFLQILEDGRMTDGQGRTVYFSETVIIFTSNLGIYRREANGNRVLQVGPEEPYERVEEKVRAAVSDYFKSELGRPELLNRIGENIVVFDFIREAAAGKILDRQLEGIIRKLHDDNRVTLVLEEKALAVLSEKVCRNLENGGRGVGNVVEEAFLNPLAAYMLDHDLLQNCRLRVCGINAEASPVTMEIEEG